MFYTIYICIYLLVVGNLSLCLLSLCDQENIICINGVRILLKLKITDIYFLFTKFMLNKGELDSKI